MTRKTILQVKKEYDKDPIAAVERAGIMLGLEPGKRKKMQIEHIEQLREGIIP